MIGINKDLFVFKLNQLVLGVMNGKWEDKKIIELVDEFVFWWNTHKRSCCNKKSEGK